MDGARSPRRCSPRSATRATASRSRRSSPRSGRTRRPSSSATPRPPRRFCPAATRRRRASGSGTPTTRARCRRSPTDGIGTFYGGALGQRIVARLAALGGFITLDDLRKNAPSWVTPISVPFRGYRVWELPPNNQGIAALEMLRILEPYDLKAMGHNSAPYLHHLIEAKKLAYADLDRFVGDADHLDMPAERDAHRRVHRRAAQPSGPAARAGARGPGTASDAERDDLPHRRRRRGEHGVVHQLELRLLRVGDRGAGHRLRAAQPRRGVHAHPGSAEHRRAGQAAVPHPDPRLRHPHGGRARTGRT